MDAKTGDRQILTPSQINTLARGLLEDTFPSIWVDGELGNLTRPTSGHLYFTLKDAHAQVRCAMFKPKSTWLRFIPREGLRVLVRGRLTLYEARGDYQLVLEHMEEAGEGALRRAFEQLRGKLQAEGLFNADRKRALPALPGRVAVVTSQSGAAIRDVLSVLSRRFPLLEVDVLPTQVQGAHAAEQIAAQVQAASASGRYDTVLVTRGGGSLEDLWAFNDETLVRAIAACAVPVISAVGHESDTTLCDFAADLRAPTPSAAAELLAPARAHLETRLRELAMRLQRQLLHHLERAAQRTDHTSRRLQMQSPQLRLDAARRRHTAAFRRLDAAWAQIASQHAARLREAGTVLRTTSPQRRLARLTERLESFGQRTQNALGRRIQRDALRLQSLVRSLEAVSPLATVARGYAILRRTDNHTLVRSIAQVRPGDTVQARLADGELPLIVQAKPISTHHNSDT